MKVKPHLALDGYKLDHKSQYPVGTEYVYSNFTPRSAALANMSKFYDNKVVVFGLQATIREFLIRDWNENFFNRERHVVVREYKRRVDNYLGKDAVDVSHIGELHDLGYLPLIIKAIPEGERVNIKVPVMTVMNTLPQFFWLTNYLETALSAEMWKTIAVATTGYEFRRVLNHYNELTGGDKFFVNLQAHDFSMRGLDGRQASPPTGGAHLVAAGYGTDNLPAIDYLEEFYFANSDTEIVGISVPATEHSVMCMGGKETEIDTYRRLITEVYPTGIVSIVSDTWDFWQVITKFARELKPEIMARQPNAMGLSKVVFRPDSGDPVKIVAGLTYKEIFDLGSTGYYEAQDDYGNDPDVVKYEGKYYEYELEEEYSYGDCFPVGVSLIKEVPLHVVKGAVECLFEIYGGTVTDKGYKTLDQHVGIIYGDSINLTRLDAILKRLADKGFSSDNVVFGIGSFTYQYMTRDTFGMAMKATWGQVNGEGREIEKDPATGDGLKKSAKGLLRVEKVDGEYVLFDQQTAVQEWMGALSTVFYNGQQTNLQTLAQIRERLHG